MNTIRMAAAAAAVGLLMSGAASAATWTFGADAESFQSDPDHPFEGTFDQVYLDSDSNLSGQNVQDGITLNAEAYVETPVGTPSTPADPFMDAVSGGEPAGLGVCSSGFDTSRRNPEFTGESKCSSQYGSGSSTGDDNLVTPEVLKLIFDTEVFITELFVRDADHQQVAGTMYISTDDSFDPGDVFTFTGGELDDLSGLGSSTMFWFTSIDLGTKGPQEIYLETLTASPVPLPAAAWLFISALGVFGYLGKRRANA